MIKNYDYIVVETIFQNIVWGNAFYGKYLVVYLAGTSGFIEM